MVPYVFGTPIRAAWRSLFWDIGADVTRHGLAGD